MTASHRKHVAGRALAQPTASHALPREYKYCLDYAIFNSLPLFLCVFVIIIIGRESSGQRTLNGIVNDHWPLASICSLISGYPSS